MKAAASLASMVRHNVKTSKIGAQAWAKASAYGRMRQYVYNFTK